MAIPERRSRFLIDPPLQRRLVGRTALLLGFYFLLFLAIAVLAPTALTFLGDPPEGAVLEAALRVEIVLRLVAMPLLCTVVCLFAHGVVDSFRIAGPSRRLVQTFEEVARLRIPRGFALRKGDYLQETAHALDSALGSLGAALSAARRESAAAAALARESRVDGEHASAEMLLAAVERTEQALARFDLGEAPDEPAAQLQFPLASLAAAEPSVGAASP